MLFGKIKSSHADLVQVSGTATSRVHTVCLHVGDQTVPLAHGHGLVPGLSTLPDLQAMEEVEG